MATLTLAQESRNQDGFYVPQFELRIEGVGLPRDVLRDVVEVSYHDSLTDIDGFEITVNNWDPGTRNFKYVGAETAQTLRQNTAEGTRHRLFDPCNKEVTLRIGYLNHLEVMMTGIVTTMEPNFPTSGGPTLNVRALNVLHQLRRKQYTHSWTDKKDSEIAEDLATLADPQNGQKRFPLPIEINSNAKDQESPLPYVAQDNMYDIDFLLWRSRVRGYVVVVRERDPNVAGSQRRLYFGPSQNAGTRDVTFELAWGKSLIEFKPTLTTANQVKSVTVHGWNRDTKQPIVATVTLNDPRIKRNRDLNELLTRCDPREEIVVNEPMFSPGQARDRAFAILSDRQKEMVKATGTTVGLPDLRAGRQVVISGLGARFSGTYFVTETTHQLGAGGYTTRFSARREDPGQGASQ